MFFYVESILFKWKELAGFYTWQGMKLYWLYIKLDMQFSLDTLFIRYSLQLTYITFSELQK